MYRIRNKTTSSSSHVLVFGAALLMVGALMVYSAGASLPSPGEDRPFHADPAVRQMVFSALAFVAMLVASTLPYRCLRTRDRLRRSPGVWLLGVSVVLLAIVLIPGIGDKVNGARRWLRVGLGGATIGLQPSEVAKYALVIFLAGVLSWPGLDVRRFFRGLLPLVCVVGVVCTLVGAEDLGTTVLIGTVAGCIFLAGGAKIWHLVLLGTPGVAAAAAMVVFAPWRWNRVVAFRDIFQDPQGAGFHPIQSLVGLDGGGWWGRGLGSSIQKYGYLPEVRTDFIFTVICEELGAVGGIAVICLFGLLMWQMGAIISRTRDSFGRLLVLGVALTLGFQAAMNVAVVTVSMPTKGIPLPFVSAGGSGVVLAALGLGLVASVARRRVVEFESDWIDEQVEGSSPHPTAETALEGG